MFTWDNKITDLSSYDTYALFIFMETDSSEVIIRSVIGLDFLNYSVRMRLYWTNISCMHVKNFSFTIRDGHSITDNSGNSINKSPLESKIPYVPDGEI